MKKCIYILCFILFGCYGNLTTSNGQSVYISIWNPVVRELRTKSSLILSCPQEEIKVTLLHRQGRFPVSVSVTGCSHTIFYERTGPHNPWVIASSSLPSKPARPDVQININNTNSVNNIQSNESLINHLVCNDGSISLDCTLQSYKPTCCENHGGVSGTYVK